MKLSGNLYFVFLLSVLIPGLVLSYLSFRTTKAERILLEKALETKNLEFTQALDRILNKILEDQTARLQEQLRKLSFSPSPENRFYLTTELLKNPLVQSMVILHQGQRATPPLLNSIPIGKGKLAPEWWLQKLHEAQNLFLGEHFFQCIRLIQELEVNDEDYSGELGSPMAEGLQLLKIKCLLRMQMLDAAIAEANKLITRVVEGSSFHSYKESDFYLEETVRLLTSMESLSPTARDYFWDLHQRAPIFLKNAQYVTQFWPYGIDDLNRFAAQDATRDLSVQYFEGQAFLNIGYPWVDRDTHIIIKLNQSPFIEAVMDELIQARNGPWKEVDFSIMDENDEIMLSSDTLGSRPVALEKDLKLGFPAWKIMIYKKEDTEISALSRRRVVLLYVLLGLCASALSLGTVGVLGAIRKDQRVMRMKGNFLSAVSHELKTPLTSIRMFSEILESGRQLSEEKKHSYAKLIHNESRRLQNMIEDILNFTRLEDPNARLTLGPIDLNDVIKNVEEIMTPAFNKAGIVLFVNYCNSAPIMGDSSALQSVIQNLLDNALKYSSSGSEVTVGVTEEGSNIRLNVKDQGYGIENEDLRFVFDKFYRAGDEMTRKTKGSGLGLAIVKQIIDLHKGQIRVDSRVSHGTEFIVTLPRKG